MIILGVIAIISIIVLYVYHANWTNRNEGLLLGILTILTFVYVIASVVLVCQAQRHEKERTRPRVVFDFVFEDRCVFVEVRNDGQLPAINVEIKAPSSIIKAGTSGEAEFPFKYPITYLAAASKKRALLTASMTFFQRYDPPKFPIKVTYKDNMRKKYSETIFHDLTYVKHTRRLVERPRIQRTIGLKDKNRLS